MSGLFGGGNSPSQPTPASGLLVQSSAYGLPVPIVYGRTRVTANMLWYGDFTAIPQHASSGTGKGGTSPTTSYNYTASFVMGLCEGPISYVNAVFSNQAQYLNPCASAVQANGPFQTAETFVVPSNGLIRVSQAGAFASDVGVVGVIGWVTTNLNPTLDYTETNGLYSFSGSWVGAHVTINYSYYTYTSVGAIYTGFLGSYPQSPWGYLTTYHPGQDLGYGGMAYVAAANYNLSNNNTVPNQSFDITGILAQSIGGSVVGAIPGQILPDFLTNAEYGAGFPASQIGSTANWITYTMAAGIFLSPKYDTQAAASDAVTRMMQLTNSNCYFSEGVLKIVPYGDTTISGNGYTYTPPSAPIYSLTDDNFVHNGDEDPIKITRKSIKDCYNQVQVEYLDAGNQFNPAVATAQDPASVNTYGVRAMSMVSAHEITSSTVAQAVAQLILQRSLYIVNTYEFQLGWAFCLIEPMDIVAITDTTIGINQLAVRVTQVEENEDGILTITAEDYPQGVAHAAVYPSATSVATNLNFNAAPGHVTPPAFFEAAQFNTTTGLAVGVAVAGASPNWGGCLVWVSNDGTNYTQLGTVPPGGARYGTLNNALTASPGAVAGVQLAGNGGQITGGSAADASALTTLCIIGGAEFASYTTATLIGKSSYQLTLAQRGAYSTTPAAFAAGTPFIRVDNAIVYSQSLPLSNIGRPLYFKFTSFNLYGGATENLSDVPAYTYTVQGTMASLPPPNVNNLTMAGTMLSWPPVSEVDLAGYLINFNYGYNTDWGQSTPLINGVVTENPYQLGTLPLGEVTILVCAVNQLGVVSTTPAYIITNLGNPVVANVTETNNFAAASFPGTITNGTASGSTLSSTNSSPFFSSVGTAQFFGYPDSVFYSATYDPLTWISNIYLPITAEAGSNMTLSWAGQGTGLQIQYRPFGGSGQFFGNSSANFYSGGAASLFFGNPPAFQAWPGSITATNQQYQFQVTTAAGPVQGILTGFTATVDVPNVKINLNAVAIAPGGTRLTVATGQFNVIQNVSLTLEAGTAVSVVIGDKSATLGPLITAYNASGVSVAATIDAVLQGY